MFVCSKAYIGSRTDNWFFFGDNWPFRINYNEKLSGILIGSKKIMLSSRSDFLGLGANKIKSGVKNRSYIENLHWGTYAMKLKYKMLEIWMNAIALVWHNYFHLAIINPAIFLVICAAYPFCRISSILQGRNVLLDGNLYNKFNHELFGNIGINAAFDISKFERQYFLDIPRINYDRVAIYKVNQSFISY